MNICKIKGSLGQHISRTITIMLIVAMTILYFADINLQYFFCFSIIIIYVLMIPKKILNPKNIVFFYYFVWYVFAPLITSRSGQGIWMHKNVINKAFLMCFMTYSIAMIVLDISIGFTEKHEIFNDTSEIRCSFFYTVIHWGIYLLGFIIYILRTGGLSRWLGDSNTYFYRRGVGQYYLLYSLALTILTFFEGQIRTGKKSVRICRRTLFFIFLLLNSSFIGSRDRKSVV